MADNPMLGSRVREEDKEEFKKLAKEKGKTDADMFCELLTTWRTADVEAKAGELPEEMIGLQRILGRVTDVVQGILSQAAADREKLAAEKAAIQDRAIADTRLIREKVTRLEDENEALKAESIAKGEEAEEAKKLADTSEKERLSLLRITEDQGQKIRELEARLKEMEAKAEEANTLKVRNAELHQRAKNSEADLQELKQEKSQLQADLKASAESKNTLQENFDRNQKTLHEAKSWAAVLEERSKQLEERLLDLKEQLSDLKKQRGAGRKNPEPEPKSDDDRNQLAINFSPTPNKKSSAEPRRTPPPPPPKK